MTGTAYFFAVVIGVVVFAVYRYPQLREPLRRFVDRGGFGHHVGSGSSSLDTKAAVRHIASAVKFECIDESVEFSHYIALQVPEHLFHIWCDRMDKVGSAVAKQVNKLGQQYAKRNRAKWIDIGPRALHYVITEGEFQVETSFFKQKAAPTHDSFGEHGQAAFQGVDLPPIRSTVYGIDPGNWASPTRIVAVSVRVMHSSDEVGSMVLDSKTLTASVGRGRDNDLVVPDTSSFDGISGEHLKVERTSMGVEVTDKSTNGTFSSDGKRLERGRPTSVSVPSVLALAHPGNSVSLSIDWHS